MTTGRSVSEVIDVVTRAGGNLVAIGAVVKRGKPSLPLPVTALLDLPLNDYAADTCPLCSKGIPITDPGSRRTV
jgi:orotate phosphoribosyltransferase